MDITKHKARTTELVVTPLMEFIEEWGGEEYTAEDVRKCEALILRYLDALADLSTPTDEAIMEQVKILVLALNDLNEETDYGLIETEAREAIWAVIQASAVDCGLQDVPDDVTGEWRDW